MQTKEQPEFSDFEPLLNETFIVSMAGVGQTVEAELISARQLTSKGSGSLPRVPFQLQFKLPPGSNIGQATFDLEHPDLGKNSMFLIPVGEDEDGWYMDANFN